MYVRPACMKEDVAGESVRFFNETEKPCFIFSPTTHTNHQHMCPWLGHTTGHGRPLDPC